MNESATERKGKNMNSYLTIEARDEIRRETFRYLRIVFRAEMNRKISTTDKAQFCRQYIRAYSDMEKMTA